MLSLYLIDPRSIDSDLFDSDQIDTGKKLQVGSHLEIGGSEARHMVKVARHLVGDEVALSDGNGLMAKVRISQIDRESVTVIVQEIENHSAPRITLCVIQALTKSDRAHECVELLVEAGVDEIIPWQSSRSVGKWKGQASHAKWSEWIRGAVKQSRRNRIPSLGELVSTYSDLNFNNQSTILLAFDENSRNTLDSSLSTVLPNLEEIDRIVIVIGPEGGITPEELASLSKMGAIILRLGGPVLRSAHAGAIALGAIQSALSIWR